MVQVNAKRVVITHAVGVSLGDIVSVAKKRPIEIVPLHKSMESVIVVNKTLSSIGCEVHINFMK